MLRYHSSASSFAPASSSSFTTGSWSSTAAMASAVAGSFQGAYLDGQARSTSYLPAIVGTDAPLSDGRPSGRTPFQVPMPCVVASAVKP